MGRRFRKLLLKAARVFPPLYKLLVKYFNSNPEYVFLLGCRWGRGFYDADAGVAVIHLSYFYDGWESEDEIANTIAQYIEHLDLYRALFNINAEEDFAKWHEEKFGKPHPVILLDLQEYVARKLRCEVYYWCERDRPPFLINPNLYTPGENASNIILITP